MWTAGVLRAIYPSPWPKHDGPLEGLCHATYDSVAGIMESGNHQRPMAVIYIYAMKIMFNWRPLAFWLYNYILVNDSYPVRWPMAIWQEPPWTKIASGKSDQSQRFRTEGANLGISQPPKKNKKQITGMIEMMQRISVLIFFQGSEVMTKKMILIIQPDVWTLRNQNPSTLD